MGESRFAILSHLCPRLDGHKAFLISGFDGREGEVDGPCVYEGSQGAPIKKVIYKVYKKVARATF